VGNVVGSNIFNVWFILGLAALIIPLSVNEQVVRQDLPVMIVASVLLLVFILDQRVSFFESAFLFALLIGYTIFLITQSRRQSSAAQAEQASDIKPPTEWGQEISHIVLRALQHTLKPTSPPQILLKH